MISLLVEYLSIFYQTGDPAQLAAIASSLLAAIPDDPVALQFLGMAFYQMGRIDDAYMTFKRVASKQERELKANESSVCESASTISYREATGVSSGLADGWYQIAQTLNKFGFAKPASLAYEAASASRGAGR